MTEEINVIHVVSDIHPRFGSPFFTIPSLIRAESRAGLRTSLLTTHASEGPVHLKDVSVVSVRRWPEFKPHFSADFGGIFRRLIRDGRMRTVVHVHGLWLFSVHAAMQIAANHNIPIVINPCGMLGSWGMRRRKLLKFLPLAHLKRVNGRTPVRFVPKSDFEYLDIARFHWAEVHSPIPNGVDTDDQDPSREQLLGIESPRDVIFLGRIHPKKGLHLLVDAWLKVRREDPRFGFDRLLIAGPVEDFRYKHSICSSVGSTDHSVCWLGPVFGDQKKELLSRSALLVMPSLSENFGSVVAEALTHGLPVIATTGTPWRSLEENGLGWWVEPTIDGIVSAIKEASDLPNSELYMRGQRAAIFARREFSWDAGALRYQIIYEDLISTSSEFSDN